MEVLRTSEQALGYHPPFYNKGWSTISSPVRLQFQMVIHVLLPRPFYVLSPFPISSHGAYELIYSYILQPPQPIYFGLKARGGTPPP